jgi:hypothetical protein
VLLGVSCCPLSCVPEKLYALKIGYSSVTVSQTQAELGQVKEKCGSSLTLTIFKEASKRKYLYLFV